jgi:hypothetical protein
MRNKKVKRYLSCGYLAPQFFLNTPLDTQLFHLVLAQKMPSRRAQKTAIQQRNMNPVLDLEISI